MAIHEFETLVEPSPPNITLLRNLTEGQPSMYHFYVDGQESSVTLRRREVVGEMTCYSYDYLFYDWEFATADVKSWPELTIIEDQGIVEGLDDLAEIQAMKLMQESDSFLVIALSADFPEAYAIEGTDGNIVLN